MQRIFLALIFALSITNLQCMSDDDSDADTNYFKDLHLDYDSELKKHLDFAKTISDRRTKEAALIIRLQSMPDANYLNYLKELKFYQSCTKAKLRASLFKSQAH
jgi:hypothetical protein